MKKTSLKKNYLFNFISQIITLIIPLITTPYLARIFREEGSGQIAFANNIITYFTMLANLGFAVYGQREIAKCSDDEYMRSKTFYEITIIRFALSFLSFVILTLTTLTGLYGRSYTKLIFLFGIQVIACGFDVNYFYQGIEDFKSIAIRTTILRLLCLVCIFVFVKTSNDIWLYALIYAGSVLISNILMWPKLRKSLIRIEFKKIELKKHMLPALIIFLPTLVATIYGSLDKLMIGYLCENPDYENGCYNQALKLNQTILILITVIDSVMVARNSNDYANGNIDSLKRHISFATNYVIVLGVPLIVGMCLLSSNLSSWYLGDGYVEVPMLLNIMSVRFIASGLACVFGNQLFVSIGKEKYTTIAHIATAIANLILNFIFIPKLGAIGGAITTAVAECVDFIVLLTIAIKYKYSSIFSVLKMLIKPLISSIIMGLVVYLINTNISYSVWSFILCAGCGCLIYGLSMILLRDKFVMNILSKYLAKIFKKNS